MRRVKTVNIHQVHHPHGIAILADNVRMGLIPFYHDVATEEEEEEGGNGISIATHKMYYSNWLLISWAIVRRNEGALQS